MKIKSLGKNKTLVEIGDHEIFVSYETPVAGFISGLGYFKTDEFHSVTTSRHINEYIPSGKVTIIPQHIINAFLDNSARNISKILEPHKDKFIAE